MDIIVIELPDGHIHSSSFHVRFTSKQVLTSQNVEVLIYINDKKKDIKMKLAKSGDAYFSLEKMDKYILDQSNIKIPTDNNDDYYYYDTKIKNKHSSLFPTEEQIKKMELNEGINTIAFAIETFLGGIQILKSNIYFWKYDTSKNFKFILWDIDGTITKSDILGALLPRLGFNNWNHDNVVELINKLYENNYKIIYLTARAIFQSEATHEFLNSISQKNKFLPKGPIIMDPDGIFSSFKKGILQKQTYLIKILSLLEIKNLFDDNEQHFFAGFGNKETDAIAYRYLGIDLKNIFIINTSSKIKQLGEKNDTTYKELCQNCDIIFPKII
jgi:phosphatidate phosphatase LPIN